MPRPWRMGASKPTALLSSGSTRPIPGAGQLTVLRVDEYIRSTWGAHVGIGCLGESELLLGRNLQERQGSSQREHDVRTQDSAGRDGCLRVLPVSGPFLMRCDECSEEYTYEPADALRLELGRPGSFTRHPRFR
jgi:hypothetical protein